MKTNDGSLDYAAGMNRDFLHYLVSKTTAPLEGKNTFIGVEAHRRTPIEVAAIAFIGAGVARHTMLIVDSFQEMTGTDAKYVADGKAALRSQIELLQLAFDFEVKIEEASSFMNTLTYRAIYEDTRRKVNGAGLEHELRKSLPEGEHDLTFALSEVAVIKYMELEKGIEVKIGQEREELYDGVIKELTALKFAYLHPFFAFRTGDEVKTPYNPDSGTKNGGKRIMLGDAPDRVAEIIRLGPLNAQVALTRLGFAAMVLKGARITLSEKAIQPENCFNSVLALLEKREIARVRETFAKHRHFG